MDNAVVSDKLTELLKNRKVKAAVFTTYTFEIDFFELEVIPLLMSKDTAYSSDERVKRVQVRVELQKAKTQTPLSLEVFYDGKLFRQQGNESPRMEYLCHGVHSVDLGNSAFHAKVAFILVYDEYWKSDCLLVGAGSNNLSYAGWWENIECQHWEEVWGSYWGNDRNLQPAFLSQLREDVKYLQDRRQSGFDEKSDALGKISDFLKNECTGQRGIEKKFAYYGIDPEKNRFKSFLKKSVEELFPDRYQSWNLEIISPFFAEDAKNKEHVFFLKKLGVEVEEILMLLPKSQDGEKALCKSEYYDHIKKEERIDWAKWKPAIEEKLSAKARRLHAKIYHFYNGKQSWVFVGSVNFTHKAMGDNVEAGFFTKLEKAGPLLERLEEEPVGFDVPKETAPGDEPEEENPVPQIYLSYDWTKKKLCGQTEESEGICINIHLPEGGDRYAIEGWKINDKECYYEGEIEILENLLKNGSLIKVSGKWQSNNTFAPHQVLLQETGWIHKPLDMTRLSFQEILSQYADMSREGLMKAIEDAKTRELVSKGATGEFLKTDEGPKLQEFFCDYAKVFHAFGELKKRLRKELVEENGDSKQIDYYLTGNAPDSLPTLIQLAKMPRTSEVEESDKSNKDDNGQDPVVSYLSLLCCKEMYDEFSQESFLAKEQLKIVREQREKVDKYINECKSKIVLEEDGTSDRRERFLKWFEEQFSKDYKLAGSKNEARTA